MKSPFGLISMWRSAFAAAVAIAIAAPARAFDLTGTYDDKGTIVAPKSGDGSSEISFHSLLDLRLDPAQNKEGYASTSHIRLSQTLSGLEAQIFDNDGKVSWTGRWSGEPELTRTENQLVLRLRGAHTGDDMYSLIFEQSERPDFIQVRLVKVAATTFGPIPKEVGTYLFHKLPDGG